MNASESTLSVQGSPSTEAQHFTYASGARPLDGYTIRRGIGHGGFGEVYYATSDAGKEVALKFIRRNLDVELRGVSQCLNLKHPNLLSLYDVRTDAQAQSWVVMEYVTGESLEASLARHPNGLPVSEALDWFRGLASAVAYLHDQGLVHRDLKPANVFRDLPSGSDNSTGGLVKLGDYGLSKFISVSRRSGHTESIGTVHYMAPEIANGRYGKEIDIYALGVLLYELLTGHLPFEGESVGEVLMKHLTAQPDLSRVAEPYRLVVRACLVKDPAQRPQTVAELLALLPSSASEDASAAKTGSGLTPPMASSARPATKSRRGLAGQWQARFDAVGLRMLRVWSDAPVPLRVLAIFAVVYVYQRLVSGVDDLFLAAMALAAIMMVRAAGQAKRMRRAMETSRPVVGTSVMTSPRNEQPGQQRPSVPVVAAPATSPRTIVPVLTKSSRQKVRELTGGMLLSFFIAAMMTIVAVVLRRQVPEVEQAAWLLLTSVAGAWLILAASKLWEGRRGDTVVRRFVLMMLGLVWGAAAWGLDRLLWVNLPYEILHEAPPHDRLGLQLYDFDGQPELLTYLAYFGFLMFAVRWWLQATPTRAARASLWSMGMSMAAAVLLNLVWPFPQPWGLAVAGIMSLAVQLASPWHSAGTSTTYDER
ncbi:MAG TPA: serine/threonine-protein kinase [Pirellulales bacterium]|nr:serine/threonine-protein kinase [Pirellulales bacterium]